MKRVIGFFFVLSLTLSAQDSSEFRKWKDTRGNVIEAKLLKDNGNGTINIQKSDGWRGDVPLNLLSAEDQEYVKTASLAVSLESAEPVLSKDFEVFRIREEKLPGFVDTGNGFEHNVECIGAELRYLGSKAVEDFYVRGYFYDRDGKEIERFRRAPRIQDKSGKDVEMPKRFEPGDKYQVYFPISKVIEDRGWKTVLVLFGNATEVGALASPKTSLMELGFDEKKVIFPNWDPKVDEKLATARPEDGGEMAASDLLPELKTIKRDETPYSTLVDGKYKNQHDCLMTEVRVKNGLPEKVSVSAYFFSEAKGLVATRKRPSLTNIGGATYVSEPAIGKKNEWYPVFFAIDDELGKLDWKWAVVIFSADDHAAAEVFGPGGGALTDFKFPGSDKLVAKEEPK